MTLKYNNEYTLYQTEYHEYGLFIDPRKNCKNILK